MNPLQRWQRAEALAAAAQLDMARGEYAVLARDPDWALPAELRLGELALRQGRLREAVRHAQAAYAAREPDAVLLEAVCGLLFAVGEVQAALAIADEPALRGAGDPQILAGMGRLLSGQGEVTRSLPYLRAAIARGLDTAELRYLAGNDAAYAGETDVAEREYEAALARDPAYAPAHRGLAKLRRATAARNHVERLRRVITAVDPRHADAPLLHYALFKELDDLGDAAAAWAALESGMALRRAQVRFEEAADTALFDVARTWRPLNGVRDSYPAGDDCPRHLATPIFIVGLPRSGTTLLERILGSHPDVADAGELRDFIVQLRIATGRAGGPHVDADLLAAARNADLAALGRAYLDHTAWRAHGRRFYTDKLPANFQLLGPIADALPQARFLHMRREAMEVCFSNLKELFADAYPHSYDQAEMGRHWRRYDALMAHWRREYPQRILDIDYARLVAEPEPVAREVLAFLGLPWDPRVLESEARPGAVATASAAQVREPIHTRFLGQWRRYETWLTPLRNALDTGG
ncbi:tetratricopeptide repeat-containing sulfotransferase family protein [Arenimonas composti]|uniref:Uncharacterized protein n=1 Tax=Arenimonas composti TR7-09 = DSM 18010 TaxID=1121013 RepID=A0A091BDV2_9GAMM|nr:sulfotransferase [Arenimonas composti]KFN48964.1 hypothetical protein P873_01290 [Arenimonas composti TR7-09 = DSM 18010]